MSAWAGSDGAPKPLLACSHLSKITGARLVTSWEFLWNTAARMASSQGGMLMAGLSILLSLGQPWSPEPLPTPRDPPLSFCFPSSCGEHHPEKAGPGLEWWITAPFPMGDWIQHQILGSDLAATANRN